MAEWSGASRSSVYLILTNNLAIKSVAAKFDASASDCSKKTNTSHAVNKQFEINADFF